MAKKWQDFVSEISYFVSDFEEMVLEGYLELDKTLEIWNQARLKFFLLGVENLKIHVSIWQFHVSIVRNPDTHLCMLYK